MSLHSIGDLAQSFVLQRQNTELKSQMARLSAELSSGRTENVTDHLAGNFGHLADIEHDLVLLDARRGTATEARTFTAAMQTALERVQDLAGGLGESAVLTAAAPGDISLDVTARHARGNLESIVSALNTDVVGRSLFAGATVESAALEPADTLLTAARAAVAGETGAAGVEAALQAFFDDPGGGFETLVYQGANTDLAPYRLGDGASVELSLRADAQALRDTLRHTVATALAGDETLALSKEARRTLVQRAGEGLLTAAEGLTGLRAGLGFTEARIDQSESRIAAELTSLEFARSELLAVDPFETASQLEQVQFQLETLYTLTARSARLNLVNFLS